MRSITMPLGALLLALLPLPLGWWLGFQVFDFLRSIGMGLVSGRATEALVLLGGGLLLTVVSQRTGRWNGWLEPVQGWLRLFLGLLVGGLLLAILAGLGVRAGEALRGFLGNFISTLSDLLGLLLPLLGGLAGAAIASSLVGRLGQRLFREGKGAVGRGAALIIGGLVGAMTLAGLAAFLNFIYQFAEGDSYLLPWAIGGGIILAAVSAVRGADYTVPLGSMVYYAVRSVLNITRAIEPLIMAIVFAVWVGIGPFAGVLALSLHSIAALGKLYSEAVESIDPGPIEAITSTGADRLQTIVYGIVPQIVPPYVSFTIYRWDINVRMSTVIGFVGGGGIGFILQQQISLLKYRDAGVAMIGIAIVVAAMDYLSAIVREKIV
ncbi:MAG: ABC transporter permease subunit [Chloroflexi bacterium]|nr:ABC transporter permease subunit [Chloroflexota bacterium]